MDADFQKHYLLAEEAYGAGDFQKARKITHELLNQLESMLNSEQNSEALLAWRSCVALLAGNIHLYGLNETNEASNYYELVLASNPQDTLKGLAEQGLERAREVQTVDIKTEPTSATPPNPITEPSPVAGCSDLIRDPFLKQSPGSIQSDQPETASAAAATPWLMDSPSKQPAIALTAIEPAAITTVEIEHDAVLNIKADEAIVEDSEPVPVHAIPTDKIQPLEMDPNELHQSECEEDPLIKQALKQRLDAGMLRVTLPDQPVTPARADAGSNSAQGSWSWLMAALRRS